MSLIKQVEDAASAEIVKLNNLQGLTPHESSVSDILLKWCQFGLQVHQQKQVDKTGAPADPPKQKKPDVAPDEKPIAAIDKEKKRTDATTT